MSRPEPDAVEDSSIDLDGLASDVPHSPPVIYREKTIAEKWASEGYSQLGATDPSSPSSPQPDTDYVLIDTFFIKDVADGALGNNGDVLKVPLPPSYLSLHAKPRSRPQRQQRELAKPPSKQARPRKPVERVERVTTKPRVVMEAMPERLQFDEMVEDAMANPQNCKQRKELGLLRSTLVDTATLVEPTDAPMTREERKFMAQIAAMEAGTFQQEQTPKPNKSRSHSTTAKEPKPEPKSKPSQARQLVLDDSRENLSEHHNRSEESSEEEVAEGDTPVRAATSLQAVVAAAKASRKGSPRSDKAHDKSFKAAAPSETTAAEHAVKVQENSTVIRQSVDKRGEEHLPEGWSRYKKMRPMQAPGRTRFDTSYIAPNNQRFRSLTQVFKAIDSGVNFYENCKPIIVDRARNRNPIDAAKDDSQSDPDDANVEEQKPVVNWLPGTCRRNGHKADCKCQLRPSSSDPMSARKTGGSAVKALGGQKRVMAQEEEDAAVKAELRKTFSSTDSSDSDEPLLMRKTTLKRKLEKTTSSSQLAPSKPTPNSPKLPRQSTHNTSPDAQPPKKLSRTSSGQSTTTSRKLQRKSSKSQLPDTAKVTESSKAHRKEPYASKKELSIRDTDVNPQGHSKAERRIKLPPGAERSAAERGGDDRDTDVNPQGHGKAERRIKLPPGAERSAAERSGDKLRLANVSSPTGVSGKAETISSKPRHTSNDWAAKTTREGNQRDRSGQPRRRKLPPGHKEDEESAGSRGGSSRGASLGGSGWGGFGENAKSPQGTKPFGDPVEAARLGFGVRSSKAVGQAVKQRGYSPPKGSFGAPLAEDRNMGKRDQSRQYDDPRMRDDSHQRVKIEMHRSASSIDDAPPGPPPPLQSNMAIPPPPAPSHWKAQASGYAVPQQSVTQPPSNSAVPHRGFQMDIPPPPPPPPPPGPPVLSATVETPVPATSIRPSTPTAPATPPTDADEGSSPKHAKDLPDSPEYDPNSPIVSPLNSPDRTEIIDNLGHDQADGSSFMSQLQRWIEPAPLSTLDRQISKLGTAWTGCVRSSMRHSKIEEVQAYVLQGSRSCARDFPKVMEITDAIEVSNVDCGSCSCVMLVLPQALPSRAMELAEYFESNQLVGVYAINRTTTVYVLPPGPTADAVLCRTDPSFVQRTDMDGYLLMIMKTGNLPPPHLLHRIRS